MAAFRGSFGPVKIIPAAAMRDMRDPIFFQPPNYTNEGPAASSSQQQPQQQQPINAAFYMGAVPAPSQAGYTNAGYEGYGGPYGQNAFIDSYYAGGYPSYGAGYGAYSYGAYPTTYAGAAAGPAYGVRTAASGYRAYPQPQPSPPYRRSRTAPARTLNRGTSGVVFRPRPRGYSADAFFDQRQYKSFSGPVKKPLPIYRKRRDVRVPAYQETDFGGGPIDYTGTFGRPYYPAYPSTAYPEATPATLRRVRPYYAPSYTTYPPSTMHPQRVMQKRYEAQRYPLFARIALKAGQLILGAAILGLVLGPMRAQSFHDFVIRTGTEWQGAVVGIVAVFAILTLLLLMTVWLAPRNGWWRKLDAHVSATGSLLVLLAAFIEAYFAACYPPNGPIIGEMCHRAEWIIATVLLFINVALYVIDFVMAFLSGVSML